MATLGIRQSAWEGASAFQRRVLRLIATRLALGEPALYQTSGGVRWYLFDDARFDLTDAAYLATLLRRLADLTATQEAALSTKSDSEIRQLVRAQLDDVVLPEAIDYSGGGDPWSLTFAANGAPNSTQMASAVPASLTPVEEVPL